VKSRGRGALPLERAATLSLALAVATLAALGIAWWRDGARPYATPVWETSRFVQLAPATETRGERWLVAVNLRCPHCKEHLRSLARRIASRAHPPALGVIVVDQPARPARLDLDLSGVSLAAGAWWDSAQVWRDGWGRRVYGETFRFDARGHLITATPVGTLPDSGRRL
jgi:hypothetical protein